MHYQLSEKGLHAMLESGDVLSEDVHEKRFVTICFVCCCARVLLWLCGCAFVWLVAVGSR